LRGPFNRPLLVHLGQLMAGNDSLSHPTSLLLGPRRNDP
jgi:hypothetical protein